jgi:hypothetical protein
MENTHIHNILTDFFIHFRLAKLSNFPPFQVKSIAKLPVIF